MPAENETPKGNTTLLAAASKGDQLSVSLIAFASQFRTPPEFHMSSLVALASTITITGIHLRDLEATLTRYEKYVEIDEGVLEKVSVAIIKNFDWVDEGLRKAILSHSDSTDERLEESPDMAILKAYHVSQDGKRYGQSLEEAESSVWYLSAVSKFLALRRVEKRDSLDSKQQKALAKLCKQLGKIIRGTIGAREWLGDFLGGSWKQERPEVINLRNETVIEIEPRVRRIDDDARSVASFDSCGSDQFLEITEVHEAWKLRKNSMEGEELTRRSWSFLGLTVKEHINNSGWYIEALIRTDEDLKRASEAVDTGVLTPEQKLFNEEVIASLPGQARQEIQWLIQDRERTSSNRKYTRKWQVIDIKGVAQQRPKSVGWPASWWNPQREPFEYELIIKGETIDQKEVKVPDRNQDPFRKHDFRRYPYVERIRDRPERQFHPLPQSRARVYPEYEILPLRRGEPIVNAPTPEEAEEKLAKLLAELTSVVLAPLRRADTEDFHLVED